MGLNKTIVTRKMLGENMNRFLPKHEPEPVPNCPYCHEELDGHTTNGVHDACDTAFHENMTESFEQFYDDEGRSNVQS